MQLHFRKLLLFLKCLHGNRQPEQRVYCRPWNTGVTSFSSVCYSVLTLQISCMQCGGVALYAEYQKYQNTRILWHFLSVEGFGSDSAPSQASRAPASFCHRSIFCTQDFFLGINKTLDELVNSWEKVRDVANILLWLFSLMFSFSLFVCLAAADSSVGNVLQSEADGSHREWRRPYNVGQTRRTDDTCSWYTKVPF